MEKTRQWEKAKELFEAALQREPSQRGEFLREACGQDQSLVAEIESLLSAYARSDGLSEHPWAGEVKQEAQPLQSIGPYRLVKKIGEGGMGQVWLAEQSAPLQRQVALKLIRAGMYDDSLLRRFQAERQSLALMDHPAIAKVFDAGATPDGQPYFVMEYVPGEPITEYCDHKKLNIRERLEIFIKACAGVQHAHQKAIIHRDLKPANILVVELDGEPVPRLIDFGLAKAATPFAAGESSFTTLFTHVGGFVGTPGYMSPEQANQANPGAEEDVDTRTDVYSLGVVLYELLTGLLPFDTKQWQKQPLDEVLRQLREQDAPRPSTRVELEKESSSSVAEMRGTEPGQLARLLHGDLDWITMKALEKDRGRRYGTPSELAADLARYLNHEPVMARPASAGYRLRKYIRRHRVAAGVAAGLIVLLAGFAGVQAVQLRRIAVERDRATQERDRASRERDRANRITDFMTGMFKVSDPNEARGNSVTAREILDKASGDIDAGLAKDPELQARLMYTMGNVYLSLGLVSRAQALFERALSTQRGALGPEHIETLESATSLGNALRVRGEYAEAEKLQRETLDVSRRVLGPDHPDTALSMSNLANTLADEGHYSEAEKLIREAVEIRSRVLGPEHPDTVDSMIRLAVLLIREGEDQGQYIGGYTEAQGLIRKALDIRLRVLGPEHPQTLASMNYLGLVLRYEGHYLEAEKVYQQTLDARRRVLGPEHLQTLQSMSNLADTLTQMGEYAKAEKLLTQARDIQRRVLGPDSPDTTLSTYNLGCVLAHQDKHDEALSALRDALDHGLSGWVALDMAMDPDLKSLHGDPRFDALVARAKARVAATQ